jgi:hypothetical protein
MVAVISTWTVEIDELEVELLLNFECSWISSSGIPSGVVITSFSLADGVDVNRPEILFTISTVIPEAAPEAALKAAPEVAAEVIPEVALGVALGVSDELSLTDVVEINWFVMLFIISIVVPERAFELGSDEALEIGPDEELEIGSDEALVVVNGV